MNRPERLFRIVSFVLQLALCACTGSGGGSGSGGEDFLPATPGVAMVVSGVTDTDGLPRLGMDASGNALVVWSGHGDAAGLDTTIWAAGYVVGKGWTAPQELGKGERPDLAVAPSGSAFVVWEAPNGASEAGVLAKRGDMGRGWGPAVEIGRGSSPKVATNGDGSAMVIWTKSGRAIAFNRYRAGAGWAVEGSAWQPPAVVDRIGDLRVKLDDAGNALAAWTSQEGPSHIALDTRVQTARFGGESGWGEALGFGDAFSALLTGLELESDGGGNAVIGYAADFTPYVGAPPTRRIVTNRFEVGEGWVGSATLAEEPGPAPGLAIAVGEGGNAIATWSSQASTLASDSRYALWAARSMLGSDWESGVRIEENAAGDATSPAVALAPDGEAVAAWLQSDGSRERVWAARLPATGGTDRPITVDDAAEEQGPSRNPVVSVDSVGNGLVAWAAGETGGGTRIWATVLR